MGDFASKYVFVDTNTFLHFLPLDQIKWIDLTREPGTVIVIADVVIRELDRIKDRHTDLKIKKRAAESLKRIRKWYAEKKISDEVTFQFFQKPLTLDFLSHDLEKESQDDRLIASAIQFKQEKNDVFLLTADTGLFLKCSARNIDVLELDDKYRLPQEPDTEEKLRNELLTLKNLIPKISLSFHPKDEVKTVTIHPEVVLSEVSRQLQISKIKEKYPLKELNFTSAHDTSGAIGSMTVGDFVNKISLLNNKSAEEIDRYNKEVKKYYSDYEAFIDVNNAYKNLLRRHFKIELILENSGTKPAENIDIHLHFPDGFKLLNERDFPKPPIEPADPRHPRTTLEMIAENFDMLNHVSSFPHSYLAPPDLRLRNVSSPEIKQSNSYDVKIRVLKLKHGHCEKIDPMFVLFASYEAASSFGVDYTISADNLPAAIKGRLNIFIDKLLQ